MVCRIHLISDIHNEFGDFEYSPPDCDVVICAGDVHPGVDGLTWIAETYGSPLGMPVIFVAGNHEFWDDNCLHDHYEKMRAKAKDLRIHFLQNDEVIIDGVRFLGCTLWTDLNLMGDAPLAVTRAPTDVKDYKNICFSADQRLLPIHTIQEHKLSLDFLMESLSTPFNGKTVVVTHHAPSEQSCFPKFRGDPVNYCFASNLDRFVDVMAPELWCHGHIHQSQDYLIGTTRIICNPRGYDDYLPNAKFDPQLVVDI